MRTAFARLLCLLTTLGGIGFEGLAQDQFCSDSSITTVCFHRTLGTTPSPSSSTSPLFDGGIQTRRLVSSSFYSPALAALDSRSGTHATYTVGEGKRRYDPITTHGRTIIGRAGRPVHAPSAPVVAGSVLQVRDNIAFAGWSGKLHAIPIELDGTLTLEKSSKSVPVANNYQELPQAVRKLVERDIRASFEYRDELPATLKLEFTDAKYSLIMIEVNGRKIPIRALPLMTVELEGDDVVPDYAMYKGL